MRCDRTARHAERPSDHHALTPWRRVLPPWFSATTAAGARSRPLRPWRAAGRLRRTLRATANGPTGALRTDGAAAPSGDLFPDAAGRVAVLRVETRPPGPGLSGVGFPALMRRPQEETTWNEHGIRGQRRPVRLRLRRVLTVQGMGADRHDRGRLVLRQLVEPCRAEDVQLHRRRHDPLRVRHRCRVLRADAPLRGDGHLQGLGRYVQ